MAKDIDEKIGAMSQKNWHGLKYKNPLKNYRVHEMPTGDQLPPHYSSTLIMSWSGFFPPFIPQWMFFHESPHGIEVSCFRFFSTVSDETWTVWTYVKLLLFAEMKT